jgi:hypothetical protein
MMHHDGTIVTVRELPSKNPLREYDHKRKGDHSNATVVLPFDSEYALGFKFKDNVRRRLELWIDGAKVTSELILSDEAIIERFVDSNRRFKFVRPDHDAVSDPTNPKNGGIEIKLWREMPEPMIKHLIAPTPHWGGIIRSHDGGGSGGGRGLDQKLMGQSFDSFQCSVSNSGTDFGSVTSNAIPCSATYSSAASLPVGATVEGSISNQHFGHTIWRGDVGAPQIFRFNLRGKVATGLECQSCGEKVLETAKFCHKCGTEVACVGA